MNNSSRMIVTTAIIAVAVIIAGTLAFVLYQGKDKESTTTSADPSAAANTTVAPPSTLTFGTTIAPPPKDDIKFVFAERLAGDLIPLVPHGATVNVDPKGERKAVTINFPTSIPDEDVKASLEKIQPIAEQTYQNKGIITEVGRRTEGNIAIAAQPTAPFLPVMKLTEQWDLINAAAPKMKDYFEFGIVSPEGTALQAFENYDRNTCGEKIRKINSSFQEDELGVNDLGMVMRFPGCDNRHVVIYGKPGKFELKLDTIANVVQTPDLVPVDSVVVVENDGTLVVETAGPPNPSLEGELGKIWDLGAVIVQQAK